MKIALTSAVAVAAALVAAVPASASVFYLNSVANTAATQTAITIPPTRVFAPTQCFSGSASACSGVNDQTDTSGGYSSTYYFQLASNLVLTSSNLANTGSGVTFGGVTLYSDGTAGYGTSTTGGRAYVLTTSGSNSTENLTPDMVLTAGFYRVIATGTLNDNATTVTSNFTFRSTVPEPATWGLMVLGFGAIGGALRTSRRKVVFA